MPYVILVVDDEQDVRSFFTRAVAQLAPGATVLSAADGAEALAIAARRAPDLIISDQHMPAMSGLELYRSTLALGTPFILVSADSQVQWQAEAAGVPYFMAKPCTLRQIREAMRSFLAIP